MSMRMGNGFRPYGFCAGELVMIEDENEIFIVIQEYFDDIVLAPRLRVITATGKIGTYPLAWFKEVDEDATKEQ
jgi:hypothetical protein